MTALVPTKGHAALIDFAREFVGPNGIVDVIVSTRSHEPVAGSLRVMTLKEHYSRDNVFIIEHADDFAPQNPSSRHDWNYWRDVVVGHGEYEYDYLFASEPYGAKMAELIGAEFIPFDPGRVFETVKGTDVRKHLEYRFDDLLPEFGRRVSKKVVFFGQESCGKTTMTREMAAEYCSYMTDEWARPYLESMDDKTVTDEKMHRIAEGQYALQRVARSKGDRPFVFHDTDLLSTIGYGRIYGGEPHPRIEDWFRVTKADLYVVMNDAVPFVPDPLRYGGDVRESTRQFWVDLLEEYGCRYHLVESTGYDETLQELYRVVDDLFGETWKPIREFERE
jgi:NadR type nicotinamide-nucleotide adenylyltransferase